MTYEFIHISKEEIENVNAGRKLLAETDTSLLKKMVQLGKSASKVYVRLLKRETNAKALEELIEKVHPIR